MRKVFLLAWFFTLTTVKSQVTNFVYNGGFEETRVHMGVTKFTGWNFQSSLASEKVVGYIGNNAAKVYANSGSFKLLKSGQFNALSIGEGSSYKLSYWVKGEEGVERLEPFLSWYDANGERLSGNKVSLGQVSVGSSWTEKTATFTAPSIGASAGLTFKVFNSGASITIDEVSVVKTAIGVSVPAPTGLEINAFQRELEINWHEGLPNTKWEILINGVSDIVTTNNYIATKLEPNTNYSIKLRTLIDGVSSSFLEKNKKTESFKKSKEDPMRVPHLRTLNRLGDPSQTINLFYTDLYNTDAIIIYEVDGQRIPVIDNKLTFPKTGKLTMKTKIRESDGYEWEIDYNLNIK